MEEKLITVTSPLLPSLDELNVYLKDIWKRKWITNNGHYHKELENALCEYLGVPFINSSLKFEIMAKQLYVASQRVL